jgi:hypothetical protein
MSVNDGKWSTMFSLETAGTTGVIECKDETRNYVVRIKILLIKNYQIPNKILYISF